MQHRVHFSFWLGSGVWSYRFIEHLEPLGAVRVTRDSEHIRGIAERCGGVMNSEAKCMLDFGISQGQGGMYLMLSDEQYAKLKKQMD